jgi:biotin carboxylase
MTTKTLQRRVLLDHGVDDTGFNALATAADLVALEGGSLSLPMVIKPDSGFGSRDVTVVHSAEQLAGTGRRVLASGTPYIAEELLVGDLARVGTSWGPYCSVEMLSYGMRHLPIAVVGRGRLQAGFKETANIHPSTLESDDLKSVVELAAQALTSLGPVYGCTHTEIMLTPSGPRIIEINGRLGGGIAPLLRESLGIDVIRLALACALGEAPSVDRVTGVGAFGWIALYPEPEFVERVPFSQLRADLLRDPNVISVAAQHRYVRNFFADSSSHSVEAIVRAPDHDQLSRTIERAVRLVDGIFQ